MPVEKCLFLERRQLDAVLVEHFISSGFVRDIRERLRKSDVSLRGNTSIDRSMITGRKESSFPFN